MKRKAILVATAITAICWVPGLVLAYSAVLGYQPTDVQKNAAGLLILVGSVPCVVAWGVAAETKR